MKKMTRRSFLGTTTRSAAGLAVGGFALTMLKPSWVLGANERLQVALIGCGGRGNNVSRNMITEAGVEVSYLCDLNPERLAKTTAFLAEVQERKPAHAARVEDVLASKDVDAVIIATPDHWHAPLSIMAAMAGKDVYVEKPHAHNVRESQVLLEAARKYDRIVEVGTQNRSAPYVHAAREHVQSGKIGKVSLLHVYNLKKGGAFKLGDAGTMPAGMDWDRWLGPAPERAWHQEIFEGGWHHFWDYSGGDIVDDGIHQIDAALMIMGDPGFPKSVSCSGGRLAHRGDDSETPDVQIVIYEFDDFIMNFELTNYPKYMEKESATIRRNDLLPYWTMNATRVELFGSDLLMTFGRHGGGWITQQAGGGIKDKTFGRPGDEPHCKDFVESVKTRRRPSADIEIAHVACTMTHMGNIAHRLGNVKLNFDGATQQFTGPDAERANAMLGREYREKYAPAQI